MIAVEQDPGGPGIADGTQAGSQRWHLIAAGVWQLELPDRGPFAAGEAQCRRHRAPDNFPSGVMKVDEGYRSEHSRPRTSDLPFRHRAVVRVPLDQPVELTVVMAPWWPMSSRVSDHCRLSAGMAAPKSSSGASSNGGAKETCCHLPSRHRHGSSSSQYPRRGSPWWCSRSPRHSPAKLSRQCMLRFLAVGEKNQTVQASSKEQGLRLPRPFEGDDRADRGIRADGIGPAAAVAEGHCVDFGPAAEGSVGLVEVAEGNDQDFTALLSLDDLGDRQVGAVGRERVGA